MSDEITPALTPGEWATPADEYGQRLFMFDGNETMVNLTTEGIRVNWEAGYEAEMAKLSPSARHAVAALCLHEQPFGFTQEDVDFIENVLRGREAGGFELFEDTAHRFDLCAKIAAFLPPV